MSVETLRPNQRVFLWRPVIRRAVTFFALGLAAHFFLPLFLPLDLGLLAWLGLALFFSSLVGINRWVAYKKTFYEFHDERLVVKTGSIATSSTIDLPYRNVTQVILRLPWIENLLFSTGHIRIHAAGSSRGMAALESIDDPHEIYDRVADQLRDSGFSLARKTRLQRETPHVVGTLIDTSSLAISALVALLFVGMTIAGTIMDMMDLSSYFELYEVLVGAVETDDPQQTALAMRGTLGLALLAILTATVGLAKLAIHFVDLNRRTYTLWDDVVDYVDGFLTETYKFIPIENLADTETSEPFLKRIFGMANVVLRPHGAAGGISFPSMPRAAQFRDHLDGLIERSQKLPVRPDESDLADSADETGADSDLETGTLAGAERRLPEITDPPVDFGPSLIRRLISAGLDAAKFPAALVALLAIGYAATIWAEIDLDQLDLTAEDVALDWMLYAGVIAVALYLILQIARAVFFCFTTSYHVGRRKVTWERDFISRSQFEFTTDKITAVEVERDFVDRMTGCATITFWSIGNSRPLIFEDVNRSAEKVEEIRRRLGLLADPDEARATHRPRVSFLDYALGRLYSNLFWIVLAAVAMALTPLWAPSLYIGAALFALPVIRFVHNAVYYPRCQLRLFDDHLSIRRGIIFITEQFAAYDQLRSVAATRYPGRKAGSLRLIPGSNRQLRMPFLSEVTNLHETLDDLLYAHPMRPVRQIDELNRTPHSQRRPLARNAVLKWTVATFFVAAATIIPLVLVYLWYRRTEIFVEEGRIRRLRGLLFRTTQTVLVNRIDQILTDRGPLNTLFRNGKVSILTVGSSLPTLLLGPISDEQALYDELESQLTANSQ